MKSLEYGYADMLTGCVFIKHPTDPALGILRLDTKGDPHFFAVTCKGLLKLSEMALLYAADMSDVPARSPTRN
jgi:hypothetical protein